MRYHEFIRRVAERADLTPGEQDAASRAITATLATLGECLESEEVGKLAAELPEELQAPLYHYYEQKGPQVSLPPADHDEFWDRVVRRVGGPHEQAEELAIAVLDTLQEAISSGALAIMRAGLPFDAGLLRRRV